MLVTSAKDMQPRSFLQLRKVLFSNAVRKGKIDFIE